MTTRVLPREEWSRLSETEIPALLPLVNPDDVRVVVVEREARIVAAWAVFRATHLEGVWIAPEYRRHAGVARALLVKTKREARAFGAPWAFTGSQSDEVSALLVGHLGAQKVPMETYVMPLGEA